MHPLVAVLHQDGAIASEHEEPSFAPEDGVAQGGRATAGLG